MNSELYEHPSLYDALLPATAHVPYYAELARQAGGAVLELACGTGQLTVPIAAAGVPIMGLDLSASMLEIANQRAASTNVQVQHVLGDMRAFDLGRTFSLIFVARNSLLHLHSIDDFMAAFRAIRMHLADGGIFAFDIFNPNVHLLARPSDQRFAVFQKDVAPFGRLSVEQTMVYDAATQVSRARWYISTPEQPDAWELPLELRNIFPQELPLLLRAGGFQLSSHCSDFEQTPFHSASRMQVCICRAAA